MIGITRLGLVLLVVLTIVYVCLFLYWRSGMRMRLEEDWVMEGRPGDRDAWVEERLAPRAQRLHRWLIALVYGLPILVLSLIIYFTN